MSDPLERLRAVNPVRFGGATWLAPDPVLFHRIVSGPVGVGRMAPRRRRARRLVPAVAVAGLLGGAAAYGLLRDPVTRPQDVACHERLDLESRTEVVSVDERGPLAACEDLWRRGVFGGGGDVPPLVECALPSGVAGVFPVTAGPDACARLTLPPVPTTGAEPRPESPAQEADVSTRILAFRQAILPQFLDAACVEPTAGADIVRRELDRAGLGHWTVRGGGGAAGDGFSAERPCATLSLRPEAQEVVLVPSTPRR